MGIYIHYLGPRCCLLNPVSRGGRAESLHATKGQISSHPASDQLAQDKSVRALLNNYKNKRPLALLIDDKYVLFPYDLGAKDITYAVLGFYTVEHVWGMRILLLTLLLLSIAYPTYLSYLRSGIPTGK